MTDRPELDETLQRAVALLQEEVPAMPGLVERIGDRGRARRRRRRGVAGGVTVLLLGVLVFRGAPPAPPVPPDAPPAVSDPAGDLRTFTLDAPASRDVALVGDFTGWRTDSIHLATQDDGTWAVTVHLAPGRYRYAYVVDDEEWRADPDALLVPDDFGRPTSVVVVGGDGPPP